MKRAVYFIIFQAFFLIHMPPMYSQSPAPDSSYFKNHVSLNLTRLILNEARLTYERNISRRHVVKVAAGYLFSTEDESYGIFNSIFTIPLHYKATKGYFFSLGYNYIYGKKRTAYLSAETYFSRSSFDEKYFEFCVGTSHDSYVELQSMQLNKTGVKFLWGRKLPLAKKDDAGAAIDLFFGFGIQHWDQHLTIFKKKTGCGYSNPDSFYPYDPPKEEINSFWRLTLHAGIALSFAFQSR